MAHNKTITQKLAIILATAAVIFLAIFFAITTHSKQPNYLSAGQNTKGQPKQSPSTTNTNKNESSQGGGDSNATNSTTKQSAPVFLQPPSGDFVSAHNVQMSSILTSVCNTTPGANCYIKFEKNGTTRVLTTETTDEGGSAYWNQWTPADVGLSPGTWQVQAVATLGGQTKSTNDAKDMTIQ